MAKRKKNHPGSIDQRGDTYRLRMSVGGSSHSFNLKGVTRHEAEQFAREKHQELLRQEQRAELGFTTGMLFSELLTLFRADYIPTLAPGTQQAYAESLKPIEHYFVKELRDPSTRWDSRPAHKGLPVVATHPRSKRREKGTAPQQPDPGHRPGGAPPRLLHRRQPRVAGGEPGIQSGAPEVGWPGPRDFENRGIRTSLIRVRGSPDVEPLHPPAR